MSPDPIVDTALVQEGVPGIQLQGDHLRLTMFPEAGAKILDLAHLPTGSNLLWQNPRVPLRRTYPGAAFDDAYLRSMFKAQEKTVGLFIKETGTGADADTKVWAAKITPRLQAHLSELRELGGSRY